MRFGVRFKMCHEFQNFHVTPQSFHLSNVHLLWGWLSGLLLTNHVLELNSPSILTTVPKKTHWGNFGSGPCTSTSLVKGGQPNRRYKLVEGKKVGVQYEKVGTSWFMLKSTTYLDGVKSTFTLKKLIKPNQRTTIYFKWRVMYMFFSNARETAYLYHIGVSSYVASDAYNQHSMREIH